MVVLVKCSDDTYTVAMESRLAELIAEGLVVQVLRNGVWTTANRSQASRESGRPNLVHPGVTAMASSF